MSDRRPEKLWKITATYGPDDDPMMWEEATVDEALAVVRRGVESGTIKGEVERWCVIHKARQASWGKYEWCYMFVADTAEEEPCHIVNALVIPVSDGGSET